MIGTPDGVVAHPNGDLRKPETILAAPELRAALDLSEPVGLLLLAVLHFLLDADHPQLAVRQLLNALPPGSYVALSHATVDEQPDEIAAQLTLLAAQGRHGPFQARTRAQIAAFLDGLAPVEPGLVPVDAWRPDSTQQPADGRSTRSVRHTAMYAAVGKLAGTR